MDGITHKCTLHTHTQTDIQTDRWTTQIQMPPPADDKYCVRIMITGATVTQEL